MQLHHPVASFQNCCNTALQESSQIGFQAVIRSGNSSVVVRQTECITLSVFYEMPLYSCCGAYF